MNQSSPLSMMQAMLLILTDQQPRTDALFIHGVMKTELNDIELKLGRNMLHGRLTKRLVLNKMTAAECKKHGIAYGGYEAWLDRLRSLSVEESDILFIPPSVHTGTECDNLITLALEQEWDSLTIMSQPEHLLRCMLQIVYVMEVRNVQLKVYALTPKIVNWGIPAVKMVMNGPTIAGNLFTQIAAEYQRVEKYKDRSGTGYMPHATLDELIAYYHQRDNL
ncbi:hypothetical protein KW782_01165 [Candidatus Parcubacteria bacterium]|nr:hypothetical protein [Candidatus Parcubacteria bacterium]